MSLVFHYAPMTSATRIHWALEEVSVPYEKVKVDLAAGDQKKPAYLAMNPNGKVPLLVADGLPIYESLAILLYLGETYGVDKGVFPAPGLGRAEAVRWMVWGNVTLGEAAGRVIRNTTERFPVELRNEKAGEAAKKELFELWGMVDQALNGKEWLVGGRFTFADLAIAGFTMITQRIGVEIGSLKNVGAWSGRCMTRPAIGRVMAEYMGGGR